MEISYKEIENRYPKIKSVIHQTKGQIIIKIKPSFERYDVNHNSAMGMIKHIIDGKREFILFMEEIIEGAALQNRKLKFMEDNEIYGFRNNFLYKETDLFLKLEETYQNPEKWQETKKRK